MGSVDALVVALASLSEEPRQLVLTAPAEWWESANVPEPRPSAVLEPLRLELSGYCLGRRLLFRGKLRGRIQIECGRCGEAYAHDLAEGVSLLLEPLPSHAPHPEGGLVLDEDDLELGRYAGDRIDLTPVLTESLMTAWPMQPRCDEACRGLCPQCGENLNESACACDREGGSRPLAGLAALLRDKSRDEQSRDEQGRDTRRGETGGDEDQGGD
jgi:uncharacterized protein